MSKAKAAAFEVVLLLLCVGVMGVGLFWFANWLVNLVL